MEKSKSILFVCTGNTCRSSMAEGIAKVMVTERFGAGHGWRIASAGTHAWAGAPAADQAIQTMAELGIDLTGHRARSVQPDLILAADAVYTMTATQQTHLAALYPAAAGRIRMLAERDIADPVGGSLADYRACAREMAQAIEVRLRELAAGN